MPATLESDVRRVAVQIDTGRLDLALPADTPIAAMLPAIVDIAAMASSAAPPLVPANWQLSRIGGRPLSSRNSLRANGVNDGDLLMLTRVESRVGTPPVDDSGAAICTTLDRAPRWTPLSTRVAAVVVSLCCGGLTVYALLRGTGKEAALTAGAVGVTAFIGAVVCARVYRVTVPACALAGLAVMCATTAGYLAVPGDPTAPKLMLAASSCATGSILAIRWIGSGLTVFAASATIGLLVAAGACPGLIVPLGTAAAGSILAAIAMVVIALAARLALWASRLPVPRLPDSFGGNSDDAAYGADDALRAHALATGLVCGSSAAAAAGAIVATSAATPVGALFSTVVGLAMTLRAGTHVDLIQSGALILGGTTGFAAAFVWSVNAAPQQAHWIALIAAAVAAASARLSATAPTATVSPLIRRCGELIEYAALAAVIPLSCLLSGVFGAVRGMA